MIKLENFILPTEAVNSYAIVFVHSAHFLMMPFYLNDHRFVECQLSSTNCDVVGLKQSILPCLTELCHSHLSTVGDEYSC